MDGWIDIQHLKWVFVVVRCSFFCLIQHLIGDVDYTKIKFQTTSSINLTYEALYIYD